MNCLYCFLIVFLWQGCTFLFALMTTINSDKTAPDRRERGNKRCFCPSVCPSVCLSVAYIANNSRTQRPSVPKFGMKVPHLRRDSHTSFKEGQSWRWAGTYHVGRTRRPHCLFDFVVHLVVQHKSKQIHSKSTTNSQQVHNINKSYNKLYNNPQKSNE